MKTMKLCNNKLLDSDGRIIAPTLDCGRKKTQNIETFTVCA